ncbi:hypothetical protein QTP70_004349 [Hemibagrus guttatus]|uniref:Fibronectin type-III domain-containing protein n=1 Tax=Hemibagrus guttatus TaxID=175788 RepID=A0AAE0QGC9_9TELE|nr:hypothetical protein QTP70_004349 [Hemibagrus guttatus]
MVELSDSTSHTITDAYVGKEYIIQVAAKDMEIGTWSDWSVAVHATPWTEEPKPITSTTEVDLPIGEPYQRSNSTEYGFLNIVPCGLFSHQIHRNDPKKSGNKGALGAKFDLWKLLKIQIAPIMRPCCSVQTLYNQHRNVTLPPAGTQSRFFSRICMRKIHTKSTKDTSSTTDKTETTPSAAPPSPRPRVGGATGGCSALLCSSHILLACVLLSMM